MTDQIQNPEPSSEAEKPGTSPTPSPPEYQDWRAQRRAERMARREARVQRRSGRPFGWFGGAILIVIGILFLLENMGYRTFANWWALLILIPAFWSFVAAWNIYRNNNSVTAGVLSSIIIGLLLTIFSGLFLFNLAVGLFWPVLIIVGGLVLIISAISPR